MTKADTIHHPTVEGRPDCSTSHIAGEVGCCTNERPGCLSVPECDYFSFSVPSRRGLTSRGPDYGLSDAPDFYRSEDGAKSCSGRRGEAVVMSPIRVTRVAMVFSIISC